MNTHSTSHALTEYPYGWFSVGYSTDLKPGQILKRRLFGRELVLFRTLSGKAALADAYCPHLGAHFGFGGTIEGESIRCPFHGFRFNAEGDCVSIPQCSQKLPKTKLKTWNLVERNGFLFTYFDSNATLENCAPRFELPLFDDETLYTKVKGMCRVMRGHPQEILENSVDFDHLIALHGFDRPPCKVQITKQGFLLMINAEIERSGHLFTRKRVRALYKTFIYGLGVSYVDVQILQQDIQLRLFGMVTPVDPGIVELRLAVQLHRITKLRSIHPLFVLFPKRWVESFILHEAFRAYVSDVSKDFPIWENKIYISSPAPVPSNGPILRYRAWARQFYNC